MSEHQTTTSRYRTVRFEPTHNNRVLLNDIEREVSVSVRTEGYEGTINETLAELVAGNLIEATVVGDPGERNSWEFDSVNILSDEELSLHHEITTEEIPGPVQTVWESRDDGSEIGWDTLTLPDTGEIQAELQTFSNQRGELNIWQAMLEGRFTFEPWYSGETLYSLPGGVHDLIVVNPDETEYTVLFAFPADSPALEEIRQGVAQTPQ